MSSLEKKAGEATERFHVLAGKIKTVEAALAANAELKGATVNYAKTRPVFEAYKASRYNQKFLAEHEADIEIYRAARAKMSAILDGAKLTKMEKQKEESRRLAAEKRSYTPSTGRPGKICGKSQRQKQILIICSA